MHAYGCEASLHFCTKTTRMPVPKEALRRREFAHGNFAARSELKAMQEQRARQILQALVQGVDPFNGEGLPAGTVLQQADVLRAFVAGLAALDQNAVRASRRAQLPQNNGRPWSEEE